MKSKITKYYLGIGILAMLVLGLTIYVATLGANSKQDNNTQKKAQEVATSLNKYISKNNKIPDKLDVIDVKDIPDTIKYTKNDDGTYKFCVTYKAASSYGSSVDGFFTGDTLQSTQEKQNPYDYNISDSNKTYTPSTLYLSYSHKKGENCQTVKPYVYNFDSYLDNPGSSDSNSSSSNSAKDTERKTDLKAIASQLEVYYANNGQYPTQANLNSSSWLATNLKGLDKEALKDPSGKTYYLYSSSYKGYYGYRPVASDGLTCNNSTYPCVKFTLTATLENGTKYTVKSLN